MSRLRTPARKVEKSAIFFLGRICDNVYICTFPQLPMIKVMRNNDGGSLA